MGDCLEPLPTRAIVLIGLAVYMLAGSLVDLYAYLIDVVGIASLLSIAVRFLLAGVIVWLIPRRTSVAT